MNHTTISPQEAWERTRSALKTNMSRTSFAYLENTRALAYEAGKLIVATQDAYQQDVLENRVQKTASNLLVGVLGRPVEVRFVRGLPEAEEGSEEIEEKSTEMQLRASSGTRYEDVVQPQRIVLLLGYALRHLAQKEISPEEMSLWMSARQAAYFPWKKSRGGTTFQERISWRQITRFSGISKTTYFRWIKDKEEIANGMLRRLPEKDLTGMKNHWDVAMTPFLTRHDASVLMHILSGHLAFAENADEGAEIALEVLADLQERSPAEYLDGEIPVHKNAAKHVVDILRQMLDWQGDLPGALYEAGEALEAKLLNAYGKVVITHHFLTEVVPFFELTQAQMWAIIALRDRLVYDYQNGIEHDYLKADHGAETLAAWTGVSTKSIRRWLAMPKFSQFIRPYPDQAHEEESSTWQESGGVFYQVLQTEPPLAYIEGADGSLIPIWRKRDLPAEQGTDRDRSVDKVIQVGGQPDTGLRTAWDRSSDRVGQVSGQGEPPLNNLFKPLQPSSKPLKPLPTTPPATLAAKTSPVTQGGAWDMSVLLECNPVSDPKLKAHLLAKSDPTAFVSWLIYGYSQDGHGLKSPVNHAISKLGKNPRQGAGQHYYPLARLGPEIIRVLLQKRIRPYADHDLELPERFRHVFKAFSEENIYNLAHTLFPGNWEEP
ncbi:MAG: hypothetical protein HN855_10410 [Anaerolineae bacterium]|jgi:hypothetical protein|nr:hypothetical protein [Anaerolineae bacterium]MBT7325563.1 hypothetical protein [Anaerolineae bacterium]